MGRYHAPSVDLAQLIDEVVAESFDRFLAELLERITDRNDFPRWKDLAFFKRLAP